jgi:uncharacterized protein (TIGR02246 family)
MTDLLAADILAKLLHDWRQAFNERQPGKIASLFAHDALFQGISPRLRHGRQEIFGYYDRVTPGTEAQATVVSGAWLGAAIVHGFADATFTAPTGDAHLIRLSIVAEQQQGIWLIRHYHAATRQ